MVHREIVHPWVPPECVMLLLVHHQLLDQLGLLHHVKVEAHRRFASPGWGVIASVRGRHCTFRRVTGRHTRNFELSRKCNLEKLLNCINR